MSRGLIINKETFLWGQNYSCKIHPMKLPSVTKLRRETRTNSLSINHDHDKLNIPDYDLFIGCVFAFNMRNECYIN